MKINSKILIVGAGLLLGGCFHEVGTTSEPAPAVTETAPVVDSNGEDASPEESMEVTTVHYSDSGFSPGSITVEVGSTVTFVNDGSKSMWVASSVHPTHRDLAGFDQLKGSGNGSSYSYTFEKVGEWSYHNHLSAGDQGKVVVK